MQLCPLRFFLNFGFLLVKMLIDDEMEENLKSW
ncbi:hypothetical protein AAHE18_04G133400 [Arachis hypogaea]